MWGCGKQVGPLEQVHMRAARIFLGVGRQHPRVALHYELMMNATGMGSKEKMYRILGEGYENQGRIQRFERGEHIC